jgi:hypothetical protein
MTAHPDLPSPSQMKFKVSAMYKDFLSRQIGEALCTNYSKDVIREEEYGVSQEENSSVGCATCSMGCKTVIMGYLA